MDIRDVMIDLKINRRESGLSGEDLAHLLGISEARLSKLHTGNAVMTITELCLLSFIYGKTFDHLLERATPPLAECLKLRLANMPSELEHWKAHDKRLDCLNALTERVLALTHTEHA